MGTEEFKDLQKDFMSNFLLHEEKKQEELMTYRVSVAPKMKKSYDPNKPREKMGILSKKSPNFFAGWQERFVYLYDR